MNVLWDDMRDLGADLREQAVLANEEAQAFSRMTSSEQSADLAYRQARRNAERAEIAEEGRLTRQITEAGRKAVALEALLRDYREHLGRLLPIAEGLDWQWAHLLGDASSHDGNLHPARRSPRAPRRSCRSRRPVRL